MFTQVSEEGGERGGRGREREGDRVNLLFPL